MPRKLSFTIALDFFIVTQPCLIAACIHDNRLSRARVTYADFG